MTLSVTLWSAVAAVTALDAAISTQIASFIRQSGYGGYCGTWAMWIGTKMMVFGFISLPVGFYALRSYWFARSGMSPFTRFCARLPVCCLVGLLLTYFVAFPVVSHLL